MALFLPSPIRRLLHQYWRFSRGMTLGVRGVVLGGNDDVFLVRHTYMPGWHLPGGGVEPGETLLDALVKELREEGNINLTGDPVFHGMFYNEAVSRRDHVAVFVVRAFCIDAPHRPNGEIAEAGFHPLPALPEGTTAATRRRLDEVLAGLPPAARW